MSRYQAEWKPYSLNQEFWTEVLVGRTVVDLEWDIAGIRALVLDNGERIHITHSGAIMIKDDDDSGQRSDEQVDDAPV